MSQASVAWTTQRREEGFIWRLKSLVTNWKLQVNSSFWSVSGFTNVWYTLWVCVPWSDIRALKLLVENFLPEVGGFHTAWLWIKKVCEAVFIKISRKEEICGNSFKTLDILVRKSLYFSFPCQKQPSRMSCCSGSYPSSSEHERYTEPPSAEELFPVFESIE